MINTTIPQLNASPLQLPKYGYYFFGPYISMLAVFLAVGGMLMFFGHYQGIKLVYYIGVTTAVYGLLTTAAWLLARYVIPGNRIDVARQTIAELNLKGSEQVLDVGSGRGLYAIEVAKTISSGHVVGIDIWNPEAVEKLSFHHQFSQPTGNTIENARHNAEVAGVAGKVDFIDMDAANLTFSDRSFDLVTCGFVIGHLWRSQEEVLKELRRVIKDDGRLMIIDNVRDLTYVLLSTPHLFVWSYLRGRKAKRLSKENWFNAIARSGFHVLKWRTRKGIITVECRKQQPAS